MFWGEDNLLVAILSGINTIGSLVSFAHFTSVLPT